MRSLVPTSCLVAVGLIVAVLVGWFGAGSANSREASCLVQCAAGQP